MKKNTYCIEKGRLLRLPFSCARLVCKPSSVLDGHLSRTYVSARFKRSGGVCGPLFVLPFLHRVGFTSRIVAKLRVSSYLAFPSLPLARRFLSVALSLKSPSPGVTRHSCPVMLGLSSNISCDRLANSQEN